MRRPGPLRGVFVMLVGALSIAPAAEAQIRLRSSEAQRLRQAAALESQGDFDGAESVLRELLSAAPGSSGGLFALERVLRAQGEIIDILPAIDAFLEEQPESSGVRALELRVLAGADSVDAVRREAEAWIEADPESPVPYREVSRIYERASGEETALALLRQGRDRIGAPDALALEIGDLLAKSGDEVGAADEWALALGDDAGQIATITRRVQERPDGGAVAGLRLVTVLGASDRLARRRAGARIAIELGIEDRALSLVRRVAAELDTGSRTAFLNDVARRARDHGVASVASWAYDELGDDAGSPQERRQYDQRVVEVALASGDTAAALVAQRRVAESFSPGSVDRRRSTARVIRLEGATSDPDRVRALLADFRERFPNAPELDDLAASVASGLQARGDLEGAAAVLEGVSGPKSSLEHGYLLLGRGEIEDGRAALLLALTGLPPAEATGVIQFAGLLGRLSPAAGQALAVAGVEAHRGRAPDAARGLADAVAALEPEERAPMLAEAARIAAGGGALEVAAEIRTRLLDEHPDAPESAEASLALARFHARTSRGVEEAIRLLETLIVERPNAAVVPDARVELERLRGRGR